MGDQLRVSSQLVEAPSGALIWSDTGQFALGDIFQLQDSLTKRIVQLLAGPLTDRERSTFQTDVPAGAKAYEYYLRANQTVQHKTTDNAKRACDLLLRCVQEDPSYAPAWARLGRVYRLLEKFGEASSGAVAELERNSGGWAVGHEHGHRQGEDATNSFFFQGVPLVQQCMRSEEHTSELQSLRHLVCR